MRLHREMQHYGASRDTPESASFDVSRYPSRNIAIWCHESWYDCQRDSRLSGTLDPENDSLECWVLTSYGDNISLEPLAIDHIKSFLHLKKIPLLSP